MTFNANTTLKALQQCVTLASSINLINSTLIDNGYKHLVTEDIFDVECALYGIAACHRVDRDFSNEKLALSLAEFVGGAMDILDEKF